jgi:serine/threonine protein kinase
MEAMNYVHSKNVYFGGMKPQNLLVFRDYSVKIGDFGVSMKIPNSSPMDEPLYDVKGLTLDFSKRSIIQKYMDSEKVSFRELL